MMVRMDDGTYDTLNVQIVPMLTREKPTRSSATADLIKPNEPSQTAEFFQTFKVVGKIDAFKRYLFKFMDADHGKDEAMASLGLMWRVCLGTGIVTIAMT